MRPPAVPAPRRRTVLVAGLAVLALGGCGSAPPRVGPAGVDGLQVPTPSPDPDDFVRTVSNPWLPMRPGSRWEYATTDARGRPATHVVTVGADPVRIAGVPAAPAEDRTVLDGSGDVLARGTRYLAQDERGNVWLLGADGPGGRWRAGERGARAGLVMPARPRVGDGFVVADAPGVEEERLRVRSLSASPPPGLDPAGDLLLLERTTPGSATVSQEYHLRGTGLVARTVDAPGTGADDELVLVAHTGP
jgi:hypothetical protein